MCGIAGFVSAKPLNESSAAVLRRMTNTIAHRGPDDAGYYHDTHAALGHRRLSIIDLSAGHQPMANEDGRLQIVFNGEIFNHAALRPQLESLGHRYRTRCDTETIIHSFEEFGPQCLQQFTGMFAFAIWDSAAKQLFCARDRLGKKPFYYFWNGALFAFASEIKVLLAHPAVSARLDQEALPEYLAFGYVSGERSLFQGIKKLPPGHWLTLSLNEDQPRLLVQEYWDVPVSAPQTKIPERDLIAETRFRLEKAVQSRLMSDVPLGLFLSGGVDSSAIAAITKKLTNEPIKTFSVGYEEQRYSELGYASQVAKILGTNHHEVRVGFQNFFGALPKLIWHEDEPITWPSSVPLYFVSKLAAEQVKVVLTGEGSDELFGGYERYRWNLLNTRGAALYSHLPPVFRRGVRNLVSYSTLLNADLRRKLSHTFIGRDGTIESLYLDNFYAAFGRDEQQQLFPASSEAIYGSYLNAFQKHKNASLLSRMLYADQKTYLVQLLMKQDRMSMATSLESRVPLLDHSLVEFAAGIPDGLKIKGKVQKYIFKKAVEDLLPREIVYRKKMGFPTPVKSWLRDERAKSFYDILLDRNGFVASLLERKPLETLIARHLNNQEDATDRIWRLLNLQLWGDLFITGRQDETAQRKLETLSNANS